MNAASTHSSSDTPRSLFDRLAGDAVDADWRRLVALYQPFILRWLGQAGVAPADADDLCQDVLAVLVQELPAFRHSANRGAFRRWLRTVVVHRTRNFWRARQTGPRPASAAVLDALEDPASGPSGDWDREHDVYILRRVFVALENEFEPATWKAFRRQVVDGERAAAVAVELGLSVNAVLIAKSRVLRRVREEAAGLID